MHGDGISRSREKARRIETLLEVEDHRDFDIYCARGMADEEGKGESEIISVFSRLILIDYLTELDNH